MVIYENKRYMLTTPERPIVNEDLLLHRFEYKGRMVLEQENPFWKLPYETIRDAFLEVINQHPNLTPCWIEEYEAHYLEDENVMKHQPSVPFFIRFMNDVGIIITFKTNAMGGRGYHTLKHVPISFWLGKNSHKNRDISPRKFKKHFLFMNRVRKSWRWEFFTNLYWRDILKNSYWSWAAHEKDDPLHKTVEGIPIEGDDDYREMGVIDAFADSFVSIVPETFFDGGLANEATFITEKTEKCFCAGSPFILLSTPYFLENLKRLGFKTFSDFWDEDYDEILDSTERMNRVIQIIEEINSRSLEDLEKMYLEMIPILKHNQQLNLQYAQKITEDWIDMSGYDFKFHKGLI